METLYKYQEKPYAQVISALEEKRRALLFMATGLGKTAVSGHIAKYYLNQGARGLFLYCENEGLGQSEARFRSIIGNDVSFKRFYGQQTKDWDADQAQMLFASVQSLNSTHGKWYTIFDSNHFDFIIYDEAHHGQAPTHKEVIDYFNAKKLGMTGTPDREDDKDIRDIFGKETTNVPLARGIARGWLKQVEYHTISDGINTRKLKRILREVKSGEKRITVKQLNESIFVQKRDRIQKDIIKSYNTIKEYSVKKRTLIFCENIDHAKSFFRQFKDNEAGLIHSKQNEKINIENLKKFRNGELQYLLCIDKFNECIHVAGIELIVFLRATDSKRIFLQQLGRGLAKNGLSEKLIVLDFVQNVQRLVRIRELAKQIRDEAEKLDPTKELDKNVFDVKGKYYDLTHIDTTIKDILNVLEAIERGIYDTLKEASLAVKKLHIKSSTEYKFMYKKDLRLPSNPNTFYKSFKNWPDFLGLKTPEKGWKNLNQIFSMFSSVEKPGKALLRSFLKYYSSRKENHVVKCYSDNTKLLDYYSPALVRFSVYQIAKRERLISEGYATPTVLFKKNEIVGIKSAKRYALELSNNNGNYLTERVFLWSGRYVEYYSKKFYSKIIEHFKENYPLPHKDSLNLNAIAKRYNCDFATLRSIIDPFRVKHPDSFLVCRLEQGSHAEFFSPALTRLICHFFDKRERSKSLKPTKGSKTARQLEKEGLIDHGRIYKFLELYSDEIKSDWIQERWDRNRFVDYYSAPLVQKIEKYFNDYKSGPLCGWIHYHKLLTQTFGWLNADRRQRSRIFIDFLKEKYPKEFRSFRKDGGKASTYISPKIIALFTEKFKSK